MSKIKDCKNSNKRENMRLKFAKTCLMLGMSFILTGCVKEPEEIIEKMKNSFKKQNVGIIKNGDELTLVYEYLGKFYQFDDGEYIGQIFKSNNNSENIAYNYNDHEFLYAEPQLFFLNDTYPNVVLDYETLADFDENVYKKYEERYLEKVEFCKDCVNIYEIENMKTSEVTIVIGYKLNEAKIFNYETYMLEDYTGYNVNTILFGEDLEQKYYHYDEIINLITEYREDTMSLELKQ